MIFVQTVLGIQCPMISNLQLGPFDTRNPTQFWGTDMAAMAFLTLPFVPGTPGLVSSPTLALPTRQKRPSLRRASASDRLLYDSLSREVGKLKSGKVRAADSLFRRQNARNGARRSRPTAPVQLSTRVVHGTGAPVAARLFGLMCFLGPLVLAIPYGMQLFASSSMLREFLLRPLLPLVLAFHSSKFANLLSIVGLYALARNRSLHPFTRSIGRQASTLMMVQFPANFLLQFFGAPGPISNLLRGGIFMYFMYCVILGALGSLRGRVAELPGIGAGAPTFQRPGGMFRGGNSFRGSS